MDIKSSRPVSVTEAKDILAKRKEEGELGYEQTQALENAERFAHPDIKKMGKLIESLKESGKITEEIAIKIADIRPSNSATLRAVLVKDKIELSDDEINKILIELG